jgi:hypothetical protein
MGYTNYHAIARDFTEPEWEQLTTLAQSIIDTAAAPKLAEILHAYEPIFPKAGISIAGKSGEGSPKIDSRQIGLNGMGDASHETFFLPKVEHSEFCKTNRKPYDIVCIAICLAAKKITSDFTFSSDGDEEDEFGKAALALYQMAAVAVDNQPDGGTALDHKHCDYGLFDLRRYA